MHTRVRTTNHPEGPETSALICTFERILHFLCIAATVQITFRKNTHGPVIGGRFMATPSITRVRLVDDRLSNCSPASLSPGLKALLLHIWKEVG